MFCRNCGKELMEGQKFCALCGTPCEPVQNVNVPPMTPPPTDVDNQIPLGASPGANADLGNNVTNHSGHPTNLQNSSVQPIQQVQSFPNMSNNTNQVERPMQQFQPTNQNPLMQQSPMYNGIYPMQPNVPNKNNKTFIIIVTVLIVVAIILGLLIWGTLSSDDNKENDDTTTTTTSTTTRRTTTASQVSADYETLYGYKIYIPEGYDSLVQDGLLLVYDLASGKQVGFSLSEESFDDYVNNAEEFRNELSQSRFTNVTYSKDTYNGIEYLAYYLTFEGHTYTLYVMELEYDVVTIGFAYYTDLVPEEELKELIMELHNNIELSGSTSFESPSNGSFGIDSFVNDDIVE